MVGHGAASDVEDVRRLAGRAPGERRERSGPPSAASIDRRRRPEPRRRGGGGARDDELGGRGAGEARQQRVLDRAPLNRVRWRLDDDAQPVVRESPARRDVVEQQHHPLRLRERAVAATVVKALERPVAGRAHDAGYHRDAAPGAGFDGVGAELQEQSKRPCRCVVGERPRGPQRHGGHLAADAHDGCRDCPRRVDDLEHQCFADADGRVARACEDE